MEITKLPADWAESVSCAVTICDTEGTIIFMNERSRKTFASHGDLIGRNLYECHQAFSQNMIRHMLATGESNTYEVIKNGVHKIIHQTPWRVDGKIAGMVEFSTVLPSPLKVINRDKVE